MSKEISEGEVYIGYYSLAEGTDISPEIYPYHKFIIVDSGQALVYTRDGDGQSVKNGQAIFTKTDEPVGIKTSKSVVYTEIEVKKESKMNELIKPGEVFNLVDLIPYQEGKIVNMDLVHNDKMKFVVMSFDKDTSLSEHAAPGEALVFALDGKAIITYEGKENEIKAGETFHFAKGGKHAVKACDKFKMALLINLE